MLPVRTFNIYSQSVSYLFKLTTRILKISRKSTIQYCQTLANAHKHQKSMNVSKLLLIFDIEHKQNKPIQSFFKNYSEKYFFKVSFFQEGQNLEFYPCSAYTSALILSYMNPLVRVRHCGVSLSFSRNYFNK